MSRNRKDAKWVRPKDAVQAIMPHLMDKRTDAEVSYQMEFDVTELCKWADKINKELKDFKMTYFHSLIAVFAMTVFNREYLNRFVKNKRIYQRNKVNMAFVAKNKFEDNAQEKLISIDLDPNDNAIDLSHKIAIDVWSAKTSENKDFDKTLNSIASLPTPLLSLVFGFVKILDKHGWTPDVLTKGDTNYATVLLTNLGSIHANSCYHHLNNYGTNSIMIAVGTIKEFKSKKTVDIQFTFDERIADGFYFAKSIALAQNIANNPKLLEDKLSKQIDKIFPAQDGEKY